MKATIGILALVLLGSPATAHAGTELQIQFQNWVYLGDGAARLMVTVRNPTTKPFATAAWNCEFYDKDKHVVGRSLLIFHVIPWGALVVDSQIVPTNGMFQDGDCKLVEAEEMTERNKRLYRASSKQANIGLRDPQAQRFFSFDHRIQGRAVVAKEEDKAPPSPDAPKALNARTRDDVDGRNTEE